MPRPTTTERGYGWEHQQARAKALAHLAKVGTLPCPFPWCGKPMAPGMKLDYDHYPPLALGGGGTRRLAHARCNRHAGQAIGTARKRASKRRTITQVINSRAW